MAQRDDLLTCSGMPFLPTPPEERRKIRRYVQRLPLTFSVFNQGVPFDAQMVNCSQDGVCVETAQHIVPGTSIHLRIRPNLAVKVENVVCNCLRTTALGEVKWSRALGQEPSPRYLTGIRYYPYY